LEVGGVEELDHGWVRGDSGGARRGF
jgi:hypothetical protein